MNSNFGFGKCSAHIKSSVDIFQTKFRTKVRFLLDFWQDLSSSSLPPKKLAFIGRPANQRPVFMQETAWTHVLTQKKLTLVLWGEGEMNIVWQNSSKCYLQFVHKKDKYIPQEFQKFWQNAISLDFQFEKGQYVLCTSHAMWINSTHFFFTYCEKIT